MSWTNVEHSVRGILEFPAPDSSHVFDVPQVADEPTHEDVRRATDRLIELERLAAEIPSLILDLSSHRAVMSHTFRYDEATSEQIGTYTSTFVYAEELLSQWLQFQQLLAQQIGHWQAAVAVMEHDLAWQEYEASSGMRYRRTRPVPAAALAIAAESWVR